ncbi:MAG: hypothetical protein JWL59_1204 [Chthoniobacteraceae bacterium]|nr:hypothetical protein [Chthoniobacteraceae bacterium]
MLRPTNTAIFAIASAVVLLMNPVVAAEPPAIVPQAPAIPQRNFTITDFGAVGDGTTMNTAAFRASIEACAKAGGGHVVVPEGSFLTGPFELRSATDLHLVKGATVKMSQRGDDYAGTKRERLGFITATEAKDVQISGEGTIDGQGEPWWAAFRKTKGTAASEAEPRRPQMIAFTRCERVKLQGITTLNPPNTHCSLRQCKEVTIEGLTMLAPADSPNTDALNLNIRNAVIRNCHIATGDDNIVFLASASNKEGTPGVENVFVSDCKLGVGHGLSFGSYTSGGIRNITVENMTFDGTTSGIRMKAARDRGGLVENLTFKNITMRNVEKPIFISSYYPREPNRPDEDEGQAPGARTPQWQNIMIENGTISDCPNAIIIWGLREQPITGVTLKNLSITADRGAVVYHAKDIRCENVVIHAGKGAALTTFNAQVEGMAATPLDPPAAKP